MKPNWALHLDIYKKDEAEIEVCFFAAEDKDYLVSSEQHMIQQEMALFCCKAVIYAFCIVWGHGDPLVSVIF